MTAGTSARRHPSSSVQVPRMLASKVSAGSDIAGPTRVCAARWKTPSNWPLESTASISSRSRRSPCTRSTSVAIRCRVNPESGRDERSTTVTASPRSSSARARCEATNPLPPVTSERFREFPPGSRPRLPGRLARLPEVVEDDRVLVGVHAVPEPLVPEGAELAGARQPLELLALEDAVPAQVLEDAGLEAEEAAVYPVLAAG